MEKSKLFSSESDCTKCSTHRCFGFVLTLGKCFAMFPVDGLRQLDQSSLQFRWKSGSMLYTFVYLSGLMVIVGFQIYNLTQLHKWRFGHFVTLLFYSCSFATTLLFLQLARGWPKLMKEWAKTDYLMGSYGLYDELRFRLGNIACVVLISAILEHSLFLITELTSIPNEEGWNVFRIFMKNIFKSIYDHAPLADWNCILMFAINLMCTFTWNYMDLFVMSISTALAAKFKQITTRLRNAVKNELDTNIAFWKDLRRDYNAVSKLCKTVDNALSDIMMVSFANNLFVILVQLFFSLKPKKDGVVGKIYFLYSFGFLLVRTTAVSLYASSVHENSKEPMALLLSTPTEEYNIEIERFLYKIQMDPSVLTGKKLFNVSRSLILRIAGAIVTYELILIQMAH